MNPKGSNNLKFTGKGTSTTLTQLDDHMSVSFHTDPIGGQLYEFYVCTYTGDLAKRKEFVTVIDIRQVDILRTIMEQTLAKYQEAQNSNRGDLTS